MMHWALSMTASQVGAPLRPGLDDTKGAYSKDLNRMLTAAVVSRRFRTLLLTDPQMALHAGYNNESFHLSENERDVILAIHAADLRDFAAQLEAQLADGVTADPDSYIRPPTRHLEPAPGVANFASVTPTR